MVSSLSKPFFTFKYFSGYSFNIASLLWHKFKVIFYCQSYEVIFAPKTVKIKNRKTCDCWEYKGLLSCKVSAQTAKNWKTRLKEITFWWQLTRSENGKISRGEATVFILKSSEQTEKARKIASSSDTAHFFFFFSKQNRRKPFDFPTGFSSFPSR